MYYHPKQLHFFQPLLPDFISNFSIPRFFQKLLESSGKNLNNNNDDNNKNIDYEIATLKNKRQKYWKVKVENDARPKFTEGWDKFCKENKLQVGDFLVFRHGGDFIFDVLIFGSNACERQLSTTFETKGVASPSKLQGLCSSNNVDQQQCKGLICARDKLMREKFVFKPSGYRICRVTVQRYWSKGCVNFPVDYSKRSGLPRKRCEVMMIDEKDKIWSLALKHKADGRAYITGWRPIHEANGLNVGDPVIFELLRSGQTPLMKFYSTRVQHP